MRKSHEENLRSRAGAYVPKFSAKNQHMYIEKLA